MSRPLSGRPTAQPGGGGLQAGAGSSLSAHTCAYTGVRTLVSRGVSRRRAVRLLPGAVAWPSLRSAAPEAGAPEDGRAASLTAHRPAVLSSPPHRLTQCPGHPGLPEPRACLGPSLSLRTGGCGSEQRQPSSRGLAGRGQPRRSSVWTDPGTCMHITALKHH